MNNPLAALRRPPLPLVKPFDVREMAASIEDDIANAVHTSPDLRGSPTPLPLPDYVEHLPGVDEIGKLSAEAIAGQYEAAAKTIEAMGDDLKRCVSEIERLKADANEALSHVEDLAKRYRDDAKRMFEQIERASLLTKEVRTACDEMRRKLDPVQQA